MKKIILVFLAIVCLKNLARAQEQTQQNEESVGVVALRAKKYFEERKYLKALPLLERQEHELTGEQKLMLAVCRLQAVNFSDISYETLTNAHENGNNSVTAYLAKMHLDNKRYRDSAKGISLLQQGIANHVPEAYFYMGWEYVKKQQFEEAAKWYREAAGLGEPQAMNALGQFAQYGRGQTKNMDDAVKWYSQSAALGNAYAPIQLATYYRDVKNDAKTSLKWYLTAADNGNPSAYRRIGREYQIGNPFALSMDSARYYYRLATAANHGDTAAERLLIKTYIPLRASNYADSLAGFKVLKDAAVTGMSEAQEEYGVLIISGVVPDENRNSGRYWLEQAATQQNASAMFQLGNYYQFRGFDSLEAKTYYLKSAQLGNHRAMVALYRDYPQSTQQLTNAAELFNKLVQLNDPDRLDKYKLMEFYELGIGTPVSYDKALPLAVELYGKSPVQADYIFFLYFAQGKYTDALNWLEPALIEKTTTFQRGRMLAWAGQIFMTGGKEMPVNHARAFGYFKQASDLGDPAGMGWAGRCYIVGAGVAQDITLGQRLLERSAAAGNAMAQGQLGSFYMFGEFVPKDAGKAFQWLEKAAVGGDPSACNNLGECYYTGFGTNKDFVKAAHYYQQAADAGRPMGKVSLGILYENGEGVKKDKAKAKALFESACNDGLKEGCEELQKM